MILSIDTAAGCLSIGGMRVPGVIRSITVGAKLLFESSQEDETSTTVKVLKGFDDAEMAIELDIVDPEDTTVLELGKTRYDELKSLSAIFRATKDGSPVIYSVDNTHLRARGITKMLFVELTSIEDTAVIACTLKFKEHAKRVAEVQAAQSKNVPKSPLIPVSALKTLTKDAYIPVSGTLTVTDHAKLDALLAQYGAKK